MPIDSDNKRRAAATSFLLAMPPVPDMIIGSGDRAQVSGFYVAFSAVILSHLNIIGSSPAVLPSHISDLSSSLLIENKLEVKDTAYLGALTVTGLSTLTGKAVLGAGSTTVAPLKFTAGTSLSTTQAGTMEFDGKSFYATEVNTRRTICLADDAMIAPVTVADTTTETAVYTATFPANSLREAKVSIITLCGKYSNASANKLITIRAYLGVTLLGSAQTGGANVTNAPFRLRLIDTVRTIGASGTISSYFNVDANNTSLDSFESSTAIDTTTGNNLIITVQWANQDAANTITIDQGFVQVM